MLYTEQHLNCFILVYICFVVRETIYMVNMLSSLKTNGYSAAVGEVLYNFQLDQWMIVLLNFSSILLILCSCFISCWKSPFIFEDLSTVLHNSISFFLHIFSSVVYIWDYNVVFGGLTLLLLYLCPHVSGNFLCSEVYFIWY